MRPFRATCILNVIRSGRVGVEPLMGLRCVRLLMMVVVAGGLLAQRAWADDINDEISRADKETRLLEEKTTLTRHEYLQFEDRGTTLSQFESRLNDGQALMLLKDYVRAAIVFFDLVESEKYRSHSGYADAMYNLAEALFLNKNYIDARAYYLRVLDHPRGRPYRKAVLSRMMQIALNTQKFELVDEAYQKLRAEIATPMPDAEYLWGKTLYLRNRVEEAARSFSNLQTGQPYYFQARYFLGVTLIRQNKFDEALKLYTSLTQEKPQNEGDRDVLELSHLARGRLLHDQGRESEALDAFQSIEHKSKHFDEALFEICYTYIKWADRSEKLDERQKWLLEAERTLEILEVSTPDSTLVPKANLLKGDILQKMGRYDDAATAFLKVGQTYASVKQQLDDMIARHDDPVSYFNEVAGKNLDSFDLKAYLPPVAVKWMSGEREMTSALSVMKEIETGRKFVSEARSLLGRLDVLLQNKQDRINLFPALSEGVKRCLEVENAKLIVERTLAAIEERVVLAHVAPGERTTFESARDQRQKLETVLDKLPKEKKDFDNREAVVRRQIESLEQSVFQSSISLKGMKDQLKAMEDWVRENEKKIKSREEDIQEFREELRRGWATANQLQSELDELSNLLASEKSRAGLDSSVLSAEEGIRRRYTEAVDKERSLAEQIHSRLGAEGTAHVSRINELRLRLDRLGRETKETQRQLYAKVDGEAEKLRNQAMQEEKNLQAYEASLVKLELESKNLAGEVAYKALEEVRQKFYRLVMDADVGLLDVAWGRMEEKGHQITDLTKKKNAETKQLHKEFKSVLQEVE